MTLASGVSVHYRCVGHGAPAILLEAGTDSSGRPGIYVRCPTPNSADVSHHPFQAEIDDLVDCILAGRETMLNVFDAQKTMEICIAADQSAAQRGSPVALPLIA